MTHQNQPTGLMHFVFQRAGIDAEIYIQTQA
jgi:hypothetical protein